MGYFLAAFYAITAIIMVASAIYAYSVSSNIKTPQQKVADPRTDLMVTQTSEGIVCQVPYGTVRLAGNILYYGGITATPHYEETQSSGGKGGGGGGSSSQQTGYDYGINVWQGICMGPIEILQTYVGDDKNKGISAAATIFNDGTNGAYPSWINAEKRTGILQPTTPWEGSFVSMTYATGYSNIIPGTFSAGAGWGVLLNHGVFQMNIHDDGNGGMVNSSGYPMPGASINYASGVVTLGYDAINSTFECYTGADPNAPFGASPLPGLAHIAWEQWQLGTNVFNIPNVTFVVKRTLPTTVDYANMTNGANPAAVIYDIMTNTTYGIGMNPNEINLAAFNAAAAVWYNKGYGLNFVLDQKNEAQAIIEQILTWVGGSFFIDNDGKFCIYAYSDADVAVTSLTEDDFIEFSIERQSWATTYNDIRVKYIDANCDYVSKTIGMFDNANFAAQGVPNQATVDLSCFNDVPTVSRRAWELLKQLSYPILKIKFKLNETKSYPIFAGAIVSINHADYAISNASFRVNNVIVGEDNSLEVEYAAEQVVETIFDSEFGSIKPSVDPWQQPDYSPKALVHSKIFEMPWNSSTKSTPAYSLLGAREGFETTINNLKSIVSGTTDFESIQSIGAFSQYGTLDVTYPATTYAIDDEVGIIYTPYRIDPFYADLRRADLFRAKRMVLIDSELMTFQYCIPYGDDDQYMLLGVVRGVLGTTIASHAKDAEIWLFNPEYSIIPIDEVAPFWVKMLPGDNSQVVDAGDVTAIAVTPTRKAATPAAPYLIEATRSGANITATWYPHVREYTGAGMLAETVSTDAWPFEFDGSFEYRINAGAPVAISACTLAFSSAGACTLEVRHKIDGVYSSWTSLTISAGDGHYLSEIGAVDY